MKIQLVGPGGAGKSTTGVLLSDRLNTPVVDLDRVFRERVGDISAYLQRRGYEAYARKNVDVYRSIAADEGVIVLSSGFMTYAKDVHPKYVEARTAIAKARSRPRMSRYRPTGATRMSSDRVRVFPKVRKRSTRTLVASSVSGARFSHGHTSSRR